MDFLVRFFQIFEQKNAFSRLKEIKNKELKILRSSGRLFFSSKVSFFSVKEIKIKENIYLEWSKQNVEHSTQYDQQPASRAGQPDQIRWQQQE